MSSGEESPVDGEMCTGDAGGAIGGQERDRGSDLQDAANLGWKLAAVGWSGDALLDSYQAERHPVGRMVLSVSHALLTAVTTGSPLVRALRAALATAVHQLVVAARASRGICSIGMAYLHPKALIRSLDAG